MRERIRSAGQRAYWDGLSDEYARITRIRTDDFHYGPQIPGVAGAAGLVLVATVLPYLFYTKGLEGVESGKASIIANVEPVVAALNGVVIFHEQLSVWVLLGIVCVLGGVVLLAKDDTKETSPHGEA